MQCGLNMVRQCKTEGNKLCTNIKHIVDLRRQMLKSKNANFTGEVKKYLPL